MNNAVMKGTHMDRKRVSISAKRQITIPLKFFTKLGFENEAECIVRGDELIIRPAKVEGGGEFAEMILEELITKGYSGEELLDEFKRCQRKVRPAVEKLLTEAELAAEGKTQSFSYDDIFGSEED